MSDMARRGVLAGAAAACLAAKETATLKVGEPAPPFSVFTFEFKTVPFEAMRGRVVMLNYWATWCEPCREELPRLDAYYKLHRNDGLDIFAVCRNDSITSQQLNSLSRALSFPLAKNVKGKGYGTIGNALPTNYVIDRTGVLRYAKAGAFTLEGLVQIVSPLLRESAPTA